MRVIGNLEYSQIINELQLLLGKHFSKMKQLDSDTLVIAIGNRYVIIQLGVRLHTTKYIIENEVKGKFVEYVKNALKNQKLKRIYQHNNDRIIVFEFEFGSLIFEMFGKGNAILIKNGITESAFREEKWSDREIKKGIKYKFPKSNLKQDLYSALSEKYVISALLCIPLGKEYAQEILMRCGIDEKKPGNKITNSEIEKIEAEIDKIKSSLKPLIFYAETKPVDYGLTEFRNHVNKEKQDFPSFNEALDFFYWNVEKNDNKEITKIKIRIEQQKKALEKLIEDERNARLCGDFIYTNYEKIEEILKDAKETTKKKKEIEMEI